jgi:5-methylcytosine-specific restriction endonuclease McrA
MDKRTYSDRREANKASVDKRRRKNKQLLVEYKGGKCERCGYDKCIAALEFHHIDPATKEFGLTGNTYSLVRQKAEADKCMLLCANCHREIHNEN